MDASCLIERPLAYDSEGLTSHLGASISLSLPRIFQSSYSARIASPSERGPTAKRFDTPIAPFSSALATLNLLEAIMGVSSRLERALAYDPGNWYPL